MCTQRCRRRKAPFVLVVSLAAVVFMLFDTFGGRWQANGRVQPFAWSEVNASRLQRGVSPRVGSDRHYLRPWLSTCLGP